MFFGKIVKSGEEFEIPDDEGVMLHLSTVALKPDASGKGSLLLKEEGGEYVNIATVTASGGSASLSIYLPVGMKSYYLKAQGQDMHVGGFFDIDGEDNMFGEADEISSEDEDEQTAPIGQSVKGITGKKKNLAAKNFDDDDADEVDDADDSDGSDDDEDAPMLVDAKKVNEKALPEKNKKIVASLKKRGKEVEGEGEDSDTDDEADSNGEPTEAELVAELKKFGMTDEEIEKRINEASSDEDDESDDEQESVSTPVSSSKKSGESTQEGEEDDDDEDSEDESASEASPAVTSKTPQAQKKRGAPPATMSMTAPAAKKQKPQQAQPTKDFQKSQAGGSKGSKPQGGKGQHGNTNKGPHSKQQGGGGKGGGKPFNKNFNKGGNKGKAH